MQVAQFEDAIQWVMNGGRARRACWAHVTEYTSATPPMAYERQWHIWLNRDSASIINGWGGQIGAALDPNDPIRDGQGYLPTDADRIANDWELIQKN